MKLDAPQMLIEMASDVALDQSCDRANLPVSYCDTAENEVIDWIVKLT